MMQNLLPKRRLPLAHDCLTFDDDPFPQSPCLIARTSTSPRTLGIKLESMPDAQYTKFDGIFDDFDKADALLTKTVKTERTKEPMACPYCSEGILTPTFLSLEEYMFICKRKVKKRKAKQMAKEKPNEVSTSCNFIL